MSTSNLDSADVPAKVSRLRVVSLWILAILIMLSAVIYQRRTGPTYPMRGQVSVAGQSEPYRLIRSEETIKNARVAVPSLDGALGGQLEFRRFKTDDPWTQVPLVAETAPEGRYEGRNELAGYLPAQPAAGKLEYHLVLTSADGKIRVPEEDQVIIRFKDPVPLPLLVAHVSFMFFSVLIGMRTGLAALFAPSLMRKWAWVTLVGLTVGGMVLGPFVQKYAFGEYWTGFPWGYDLTDNKMLIMWVAWLLACSAVGFKPKKKEAVGRWAVGVAALVMTVVYMIPHSMRGSELDYSKVDQGIPASQAIGTGD